MDCFSIKMCTKVVLDDLVTLHHEMGHNEYQNLYSDLPMPFRDGANNGLKLNQLNVYIVKSTIYIISTIYIKYIYKCIYTTES